MEHGRPPHHGTGKGPHRIARTKATGALRAAGLPEEWSPESESSREVLRAAEMGVEDGVLTALRTNVHAICVGPVTARPLVRLGVPTSAPERMRLGALARHITDELPLLQSRTVHVAGHGLGIRGTCVVVDGAVKDVSPAGMATLRALAHRQGTVVRRADLLRALPGTGTDTHAVETAVLRLRTALGDKNIVSRVVKRGYRLPIDESQAPPR